jgi:hypothetical protein
LEKERKLLNFVETNIGYLPHTYCVLSMLDRKGCLFNVTLRSLTSGRFKGKRLVVAVKCELNIITVYEPFKQLDNDAGDNIVWEEFDKRTMR